MCEPMTLAVMSFAVGAAQSVAEHQAASQAAEDQNRLYAQNRLNAIRAFEDNQVALNQRQIQEQEAAGAQKFDTSLEARKARATHRVAAGEAGISGLSVEGLMRDFWGQEGRFADRIDQQQDWTMQQIQAEKRGDGFRMVDRINSVQQARKPSFIGTGLKIAAHGINAASSYQYNTRSDRARTIT